MRRSGSSAERGKRRFTGGPAGRRPGPDAGFTLIEVLLTLVITSLMLGAVYSVFLGTLSSKKYCDEVKDAGHCGQALLLLIQRDLQGAIRMPEGWVSVEGVDGSEAGSEADRLGFVSTSDTRCGNEKFDYNEVGYFVTASEREEEEEGSDGFLQLVRREDGGVDEDPFADGAEEVLEDRLRSFDVQYMHPESGWLPQWTEDGLPAAVRVTLVINRSVAGSDGETRDYTYSQVILMSGRK